jgi:hypothetical protein
MQVTALYGVTGLAQPAMLVEIEAEAIADSST